MNLRRAHIVLVDISGYTQFIRLHRMSLLHAERIITDLLESVIDVSTHPLVLNKLEGDAALFYAFADEGGGTADERERTSAAAVLQQIQGFFEAFRRRERELVSECSICFCDACVKAGDLRLKVIAHTGTIIVKRMRQFEEIAGEDVILTHLLLKNSVQADEYLLLTDSFHALSGPPDGAPMETRVEDCRDAGQTTIHLQYPSGTRERPAAGSLWNRVATTLRLESYLVGRLLGKPARPFRHLPPASTDRPDPRHQA
jgi:Protein of unknown function (DUF2652)